jgi:hypothetical protein
MNDSQLIAQTFHQMRRFCRDVSLLLSTAEEVLKSRGLPSAQVDKGCLSGGTYSLDRPNKWLPRRFFRTYKHKTDPNFLAYVAVIIDLPPGRELEDGSALLTAGALHYQQPNGWGRPLAGPATDVILWHLHRGDRDDSGQPKWHRPPYQWSDDPIPKGLQSAANKIDSALTFALPPHEITGTEVLIARVIEPLISGITASELSGLRTGFGGTNLNTELS